MFLMFFFLDFSTKPNDIEVKAVVVSVVVVDYAHDDTEARQNPITFFPLYTVWPAFLPGLTLKGL